MMRVGLYRSVHVKSEASMEKCILLAARKLVQGQNQAIENDVRGLLRSFGLKAARLALEPLMRASVSWSKRRGPAGTDRYYPSSPRGVCGDPVAVGCPTPPVTGIGPRRSSVPTIHDCSGRRRCRVDHLPSVGGYPTAIYEFQGCWRAPMKAPAVNGGGRPLSAVIASPREAVCAPIA